ncbi:unnamed protein product [Pseudo-nitzschia multistriata]|uniref:Uncharacterized protein n=1 Tax=Pseudo-nitzschia multistriata TaxID=183589 RepID=A0A448ZH44_9STRA|nr:unnamed protein product [Pseudo-nitzschia multistriata]
MFFNTDEIIAKRTKKIQLEQQQRNKNLASSEKCKVITSRLVGREKKKRDRLKALGIDYDFPGYKSNRADFQEEYEPEETADTTETEAKETKSPKKRRKESMDSTHSEGSASKKKSKKKKRDSIDSIKEDETKKEKKSKSKKKRKSV